MCPDGDEEEDYKLSYKDKGKILTLYMDLCRSSQICAKTSRILFFPYYRKILFSRSKTERVNSTYFINWGIDTEINEYENKKKIKECERNVMENSTKLTLKSSVNNYMKNGMIMHENSAPIIMEDFLNIIGLSNLEVFIPGRLISAKLPFIASTPDICVAISKSIFNNVYEQVIQRGKIHVDMMPFLPQFWAEVKTIQDPKGVLQKDQLTRLYQLIANYKIITNEYKSNIDPFDTIGKILGISGQKWINELVDNFETLAIPKTKEQLINECKIEAINILQQIFINMNWIAKHKEKVREQDSSSPPLKRAKVKKATDMVFKRDINLIDLSKLVKEDNLIQRNKIKYLFSAKHNSIKEITSSPLLKYGRSWILVYDRCICIEDNIKNCNYCKGGGDRLLFSMQFTKDTTPFILAPLGNFYVQIVEQVCSTQYLNSAATYLFITITKHTSNNDDGYYDENHLNHPALVYIYEVIIPYDIRFYYETRCLHETIENLNFPTLIHKGGEQIIYRLIREATPYDNRFIKNNSKIYGK